MQTLRDEIEQRAPFASRAQEAYLGIVRTSAVLVDRIEHVLKPVGLSATQYNVLRILRGARPDGLCRNEVRDRMLTRMPDMTRLLDRLESAGLVTRERDPQDRRMVRTHITTRGLDALERLDGPVQAAHVRGLGHLGEDELAHLTRLLDRVRDVDGVA